MDVLHAQRTQSAASGQLLSYGRNCQSMGSMDAYHRNVKKGSLLVCLEAVKAASKATGNAAVSTLQSKSLIVSAENA